jgi:hypothetical protein
LRGTGILIQRFGVKYPFVFIARDSREYTGSWDIGIAEPLCSHQHYDPCYKEAN